MKNTIIYLFIFAIIFSSCEDILEVSPTASFDSDLGIITTAERAELALNGMYDGLQSRYIYKNYIITFGELHSDNMAHTGTFIDSKQIDLNNILPSNVILSSIWDETYNVINIANNIYADASNIEKTDQKVIDRIQAEALFVRALSYFNLVKNWGGVPLQTTPVKALEDIQKSGRATVDAIYEQIIKDLKESAEKIGDFNENGRANVWAAKALLSRVCLYKKDYQSAYDYANDVIKNSPYVLVGNYADIFTGDNDYNSENIFEVDFTSQDKNLLAFWYHPDDLGGRYEYGVDANLLEAYNENDLRYNASIGYYDGTREYYIKKYTDVSGGGDNVIVIRLTEMYLNRAEAIINGATGDDTSIDDFNKSHTRAGLEARSEPITMNEILKERRLEFAFEGHRWYDLKRTGKAIEVIENVTTTDQYLWPIPQDERDVNTNLEQNPGY